MNVAEDPFSYTRFSSANAFALTEVPVEIPQHPDGWTYDFVRALVEQGEPGWYDFKAGLAAPGVDKTACAMANADGGFIVFGVLNATGHLGRTPLDLIPGNQRDPEFHKHLGDKLNGITPELHWELVRFIPHPAKPDYVVSVVSVPASDRRPHMLLHVQHGFYYRARGGTNEQMDYGRIRDQMLSTGDRLRSLRLLRQELGQFSHQAVTLIALTPDVRRIRFSADTFRRLVHQINALPPIDAALVQNLLDIADQAGITNKRLDDASAFPSPTFQGYVPAIRQSVSTVQNRSEQCERALATLFGPLERMP